MQLSAERHLDAPAQLAPPPAAAEPSLPARPPAPHPGLRPLIWVPSLIGVVIFTLVVFARMGAA